MKKMMRSFAPGAVVKFEDQGKAFSEIEVDEEQQVAEKILPVADGRIIQGDTIIERSSPPGAKRATWKTRQKED